jgi:hypothetical protein
LAQRLELTKWQIAVGLETIPYIDGVPAGTPRPIDVLWKDMLLYAEDRSMARMAKAVAQELGRIFVRPEITDAIKLCYDRSPEFVTEYLEENFKLSAEIQPSQSEATPITEQLITRSFPADVTSPSEQGEEARGTTKEDSVQAAPHESDDADVDQTEVEETSEELTSVNKRDPKTAKVSLIERFAHANNFRKGGDDRYEHIDGRFIAKVTGMPFPWELYLPSGERLKSYWLKDHCIQEDPLQVPAEVWSLCEKSPEGFALVLSNPDGSPREITGQMLKEMRESGELSVYPATYRLVYGVA